MFTICASSNAQIVLSDPVAQMLSGKSVAVLSGATQDIYASEVLTASQILRAESETDLCVMVSKGKADALLISTLTWGVVCNEFPDLKALCDTITPMPIAFVVSKEEPELKREPDIFVRSMIDSGPLLSDNAEDDIEMMIIKGYSNDIFETVSDGRIKVSASFRDR